VCRKSYINPAIFIAWQSGKLRQRVARGRPAQALLALLGDRRRTVSMPGGTPRAPRTRTPRVKTVVRMHAG
jgi:hypothetical protein